MPDKFYITTPIYYVNARPHIGHAYSTLVCDVIARRRRLLGDEVYFLTGTDEHGQKIERSAKAAGIEPQEFTDRISAQFKDLWKRMGFTNTDFIRTTELRHKRGVQKLFTTLNDKGFIEKATYTGQYCVSDEAFHDVPPGAPCPVCGQPTETVSEENYYFKLSSFQEKLLAFYEQQPDFISPPAVRNEVLSFVRAGLKDLSISRATVTWGIPVPGDDSHVIYVWLDALANYMTAVGYGSDAPADKIKFNKWWPADLHLVGKEITRFHCVYWPAFLMAAGLPLPKRIVGHGWLLFEESKMSKSRGNIVRAETILDAFGALKPKPEGSTLSDAEWKKEQDLFGADVLRYFLLREIPFGQDGSFSFDALLTRYNADLANGYGNLVSRTLAMIEKYCDSIVPDYITANITPKENEVAQIEFDLLFSYYRGPIRTVMPDGTKLDRPRHSGGTLERGFEYWFEKYTFSGALEDAWYVIAAIDGFLTKTAPWKIVDPTEQALVLGTAAEMIRIITALLYPVMPYATAQVWAQLGLGSIEDAANNGELKNLTWGGLKPGTKLGTLGPIFPRADKGIIATMTEMEKNNSPAVVPTAAEAAPTAAPVTAAAAEIPAAEKSFISIDDFAKVELRVAKVLVAERIPKADKLLRLEVDLGNETRQILSGIAEFYTPEELIGRRVVIVANLAPRKMRGLESHGMIVAADTATKPALATFLEDVPLGTRLK